MTLTEGHLRALVQFELESLLSKSGVVSGRSVKPDIIASSISNHKRFELGGMWAAGGARLPNEATADSDIVITNPNRHRRPSTSRLCCYWHAGGGPQQIFGTESGI